MANIPSYTHWSLEPYCIGMKLRALRNKKRLTLSRLAAETGLSTALLSKLETDRMIPTLPTLATISRVYGVGLSHFFAEPDRHTIAITRKAHIQGNGRGAEPAKCVPLNSLASGPRLAALIVELSPGAASPFEEASRETCGLVYVLEGQLQLSAGGLNDALDAGDCAYMETLIPAAWSAGGEKPCRLLMVRPAPAAA